MCSANVHLNAISLFILLSQVLFDLICLLAYMWYVLCGVQHVGLSLKFCNLLLLVIFLMFLSSCFTFSISPLIIPKKFKFKPLLFVIANIKSDVKICDLDMLVFKTINVSFA